MRERPETQRETKAQSENHNNNKNDDGDDYVENYNIVKHTKNRKKIRFFLGPQPKLKFHYSLSISRTKEMRTHS